MKSDAIKSHFIWTSDVSDRTIGRKKNEKGKVQLDMKQLELMYDI